MASDNQLEFKNPFQKFLFLCSIYSFISCKTQKLTMPSRRQVFRLNKQLYHRGPCHRIDQYHTILLLFCDWYFCYCLASTLVAFYGLYQPEENCIFVLITTDFLKGYRSDLGFGISPAVSFLLVEFLWLRRSIKSSNRNEVKCRSGREAVKLLRFLLFSFNSWHFSILLTHFMLYLSYTRKCQEYS